MLVRMSNSNQGNNPFNQSPNHKYFTGNELIWSDEFDEDSSSGSPAVSSDKWNIETVAPITGVGIMESYNIIQINKTTLKLKMVF